MSGFNADLWLGVWGPAKLPRDITERLSTDIAKLLKLPDVKERLTAQGMEPVGSTPAQFADFVRRENEQWSNEDLFLMLGMSSQAKLLIVCRCGKHHVTVIRIISARLATQRESAFYQRANS